MTTVLSRGESLVAEAGDDWCYTLRAEHARIVGALHVRPGLSEGLGCIDLLGQGPLLERLFSCPRFVVSSARQFRAEAVQMVLGSNKPVAEVAVISVSTKERSATG